MGGKGEVLGHKFQMRRPPAVTGDKLVLDSA